MTIVDRTTLNIDRAALARAAALTGVTEKTALVRMGLEALIAKASAERLAALAEPNAACAPSRAGERPEWCSWTPPSGWNT